MELTGRIASMESVRSKRRRRQGSPVPRAVRLPTAFETSNDIRSEPITTCFQRSPPDPQKQDARRSVISMSALHINPSSLSKRHEALTDFRSAECSSNTKANPLPQSCMPATIATASVDMSQNGSSGFTIRNIQSKDLAFCSTSSRKTSTSAAIAVVDQPSLRLSHADVDYQQLYKRAMNSLRNTFKIQSLQNLQPKAVKCALLRQNQIIVMATGAGKSLCYQLPATVLSGVTVVVAPLIALMIDQVRALNEKGIEAVLISSFSGEQANIEVMQRLACCKNEKEKSVMPLKPIKLLYCTPELIATARFRAVLIDLNKRGQLALFAFDEAHCLSTWGHDFRPAYRKLTWLRSSFPKVPCMACTATATEKVIQDIRAVLLMTNGEPCHMSTFNRQNLFYEVRYKDTLNAWNGDGALADLIKVVKQQHEAADKACEPCSGIIYVHKRSEAPYLAAKILKETGIQAAPYHAGLKDAERLTVQKLWTDGVIKVAVATVAFGMGIDLPHVRYVLHWSMAKSVEGFYQESGRGGRDGKTALSIVYYSQSDAQKFRFLISKTLENKKQQNTGSIDRISLDALNGMVEYCMEIGCRRKYLLHHFGEKIDCQTVCRETCDFCKNPAKVESAINASNSNLTQTRTSGVKADWDGQWGAAHGDNESVSNDERYDSEEDFMDDGHLGIRRHSTSEVATAAGQSRFKGFQSAMSVLSKYEALEEKEGKKQGVMVKGKKSGCKSDPVLISIPMHLRHSAPDPLQRFANLQSTSGSEKKGEELSSDIEQLQAEIAKKKEEIAARMAELKRKSTCSFNTAVSSSLLPPPAPCLSFSAKKIKQ